MVKIPPYVGVWLLQLFIILFPMVLYQSFFQKIYMKKRFKILLLTLLCGISIIICMTFPVYINNDYTLDFRFIPLIIAFVFGGYLAGLTLSILLVGYGFIIGGTGFYWEGLMTTLVLIIAFGLISPRIKGWKTGWKGFYPYIILTFTLIFFALGTQFFNNDKFSRPELFLWICFSLLNYLTFWMIMYLQNTLKEQETIFEKIIQFEKKHTINQILISISQQMIHPLQTAGELIDSVHEERLTARQACDLHNIGKELKHAENSLNQYLSLIDEKEDAHGECNFVKELEDAIRLMSLYADMKKVELRYISTAQEDICIKGGHSMIRFSLVNIIKNAIDSCEPMGHVNIFLHEMLKDVYVVIEDNGVGLPANRITAPCKAIKENGPELGLASTFRIAESIGGRVEVKSKPNEGTTFSLYFPKWALKAAYK